MKPLEFKDKLNDAQYKAVCIKDGPALIVAGAGTGKTTTLKYRIAKLIGDYNVNPENILALTFTNKAAENMTNKARELLGVDKKEKKFIESSTYHTFAAKVLRKFAPYVSLNRNFTIADKPHSTDIINLVRESHGYNKKCKGLPDSSKMFEIFSKSINKQLSISSIVSSEYDSFEDSIPVIEQLYVGYCDWKKSHNILDYDDLILAFNNLLTTSKKVRAYLSTRYQYIMVDEYQDSNNLQSQMLYLLCYVHKNLCVVGDEEQSIYRFRGANFKNILDFPNQMEGAVIIILDVNYRSTQSILDLANSVISHAVFKFDKQLKSVLGQGEKPKLVYTVNQQQESEFVYNKIQELIKAGTPLSEIAVLSSKSRSSSFLELELQKNGVSFKKFGGTKFLEKAHIRDLFCFLRLTVNDLDEVSWFRILKLYDGIGPTYANKFKDEIMAKKSYHGLLSDKFKTYKCRNSLIEIHDLIETLLPLSLEEQLTYLVEEYLPKLFEKEYEDDYEKRLEECKLLYELTPKYKTTKKFIDELTLETPEFSNSKEYVTVSTIHSSKGLEFGNVFLLDVVNEVGYAKTQEEYIEQKEECRRLFYVAITRAKRNLWLIKPEYSGLNYDMEELSPFVEESLEFLDIEYYEQSIY